MEDNIDFPAYTNRWLLAIEQKAGKKTARLFARRLEKPLDWLLVNIIRPALYRLDRNTYMHVSDTRFTQGRNSDWAELIAASDKILGVDPLSALTYFTNELRLPSSTNWEDGSHTEESPSDRISAGEHHVFTFEFDVSRIEYFLLQISWITLRKNNLDCPMGDFYKACSQYGDFVGISVVWSGGKSLHIHVVFSTAQAQALFGIAHRSSAELRRGVMDLWGRLHELLVNSIDTQGQSADPMLKQPEQLRRLPGGTRIIDKANLLGIPNRTEVCQVVLWEAHRVRSDGNELPLLITPEAFAPKLLPIRRFLEPRMGKPGHMTYEEEEYCSGKLRELYQGWPRFSHLPFEGQQYIAKFFNSEFDRTPSSLMREDRRHILILGRDAESIVAPASLALPQSLGFMLAYWRRERLQALHTYEEASELSEADARVRGFESRFAENVTNPATAYREMEAFFLATVARDTLMLVPGPEGIGKTTSMFRLHSEIVDALVARGESPRVMYAFGSYSTAREKRNVFNRVHRGHKFYAVLLPSFTKIYKKARRVFRLNEISRSWAAKHGYSSLYKAIEKLQPEVIEFLKLEHAKLWRVIGNRIPVFFTVHQVMHSWRDDTNTRLIWAPSRWRPLWDKETASEHRYILRCELTLGLAVHDEIKADQFVEKWPIEIIRWTESMIASEPDPWETSYPSLVDRHKSFERFLAAEGPPIRNGRPVEKFDFEKALAGVAFIARDPSCVTTLDTGEYARAKRTPVEGEEERTDIYEACHGREWQISERNWWDGLAHQTIVLTTEQVPVAVARKLSSNWSIFCLEAPKATRGIVRVFAKRGVTGANLLDVCRDYQASHPGVCIVSNRLDSTVEASMPHITARGSNDLIGEHVMQTVTYFPPSLYEDVQVLNAWTGRDDLVGLSHIDEFNQTAGRNLGFRWDGVVTHTLLINLSLFGLLSEHPAMACSRYSWQIVLDKHQRSDLQASLKPNASTPE